jgi:hypothetical protein
LDVVDNLDFHAPVSPPGRNASEEFKDAREFNSLEGEEVLELMEQGLTARAADAILSVSRLSANSLVHSTFVKSSLSSYLSAG